MSKNNLKETWEKKNNHQQPIKRIKAVQETRREERWEKEIKNNGEQ